MSRLAVGISGSPSPSSRSKGLVQAALDLLAGDGFAASMVDLATLPADALLARGPDPALDEAIAAVGRAHVVVAGTPVYRATYSGLLKCFFDLMPTGHLAGKAAVLIATAAAPGHLLAIDHGMRPLIASLDGASAATAVYAVGDDTDERGVPSAATRERLERACAEAARACAA